MDPFSLTVGTVSLVDVCWRVTIYLKDIKGSIASIETEIQDLIYEVESLRTTVASAEECLQNNHAKVTSPLKVVNLQSLWNNCQKSLDACRRTVTRLEKVVHEIYGNSGPKVTGKLDGLRKESRRREKNQEMQRLRETLSNEKQNLQMLITGIGL